MQAEREATPEEVAEIEQRKLDAIAEKALQVQQAMDDYLLEVRVLREKLLNRLAGIAAVAIVTNDILTLSEFIQCRQRLLDITKIPGVISAVDRDEMEVAVKMEYAAIVQLATSQLVTAFKQVDS